MTISKFTRVFVFTLASAIVAHASLPKPELIARFYFAGSDTIAAAPNAAAFGAEFSSPEAKALRKQTADKLAPWLAGWLQKNLGSTVPDGAVRLRPLFDDLQSATWLAEARATPDGSPELALAIKLNDQRTAIWQSGLRPFFPAATFNTLGGWLIFDSGTGTGKLGSELATQLSTPQTGWFNLDVNWPHLARWFPELGKLELPETQFTVTAPGTSFLVSGKLLFPEPLAMALDPWQFPTNLIHQPFVSFTAARGFAAWLRAQDWLQPYQFTPTPNQAFIWAMQSVPFQTFLAEPVPNAAEAVAQTYQRLQPLFAPTGRLNQGLFKFSIGETNSEIYLIGMPMFAPFIRAVKGTSGQYLFAGGFPNSFQKRPLPADLFQHLATPNVVLYHWENTAQRVPTMLQFSQLALMLTSHHQLGENSAALNWIDRMAPTLGDNKTEITVAAPDQLAFTRTSNGIFTSAELFVLANWLEAKNFPGCDLRLPPFSPHEFKHIKRPVPGAPAPPLMPH